MSSRRCSSRLGAGVAVALAISFGSGLSAAAPPVPPTNVVAVVGDSGVDVLHEDFQLRRGERVRLPPVAEATAVRVVLPRAGSRESRLAALRRGPLGRPAPETLYYLEGTRVLLWTGKEPTDLLSADVHGTGTASAAVGRRHGAGSRSVLLMTTGFTEESWAFVARQSWVDVATSSVFEPTGDEDHLLCDSVSGITALRSTGRLAFVAAGNGPADSSVAPAGAHPAVLRVGGVRADGSTALPAPEGATSYSARGYDVAELYRSPIAVAGTDDGYRDANGTSGSSPRLAGRVAEILRSVRSKVGDRGVGSREGALVVTTSRRVRGPLADGRLTADELERVLLSSAQPKAATAPGRYSLEGYGYFGDEAQRTAQSVLLGEREAVRRSEDDLERSLSVQVRTGLLAARGCAT